MAVKQSQENNSYMDGVKVKISECYKPPPRININVSYSQRLALNKQIQDNIPNYDFTLEKNVSARMKEWRNARSLIMEEKKAKFDKYKEERKILKQEKDKLNSESELKQQDLQKEESPSNDFQQPGTNLEVKQNFFLPSNGVMMPREYNNILTPTPLTNVSNYHSRNMSVHLKDKSAFNLSDFEGDTSSPFDNVELKTINDLEELAQVLKYDDKNQSSYTNNYPSSSTANSTYYANYPNQITDTMCLQQFSFVNSSNLQHLLDNKCIKDIETCKIPTCVNQSVNNDVQSNNEKEPKYNPVLNILKSLETDLHNTHIVNNKKEQLVINKSYNKDIQDDSKQILNGISCNKEQELDETYDDLPLELQELSKSISSMGFPLSRVARACKLLGNDHKKVVEHLLAMSELLDLGFTETQVSSALLQCNNDRDKALDILIL